MATRLIVWNIQKFSKKKINNSKGRNFGEVMGNLAVSMGNLYHILKIVSNADVFGIIELQSNKGILGTLVGGKGAEATLFLLGWLRANYDSDWCVVPPVKLVGLNEAGDNSNYTEAVAVFYRSDKLEFVGPYVWPDDGYRAVPYEDDLELGAYPDPWNDALPPIDGDIPNYFAGQYQFFREDFPTVESTFIDANRRRPFLTEFKELGGAQRHLQFLWVHPSPNNDLTAAVSRLGWIEEIKPNGKQKVVAVAGDFNVDLLDSEKTHWEAYRALISDDKLVPLIGSNAGPTRVLPVNDATLTTYLNTESLDNIFVRYDGGLGFPNIPRAIINSVTGVNGFPSDMTIKLGDYANWFDSEEKQLAAFRNMFNYGHIGPTPGTSDHLALVADI